MTQKAELHRRIDTLPSKYFGEVIDFVGYLEHKARQEAAQIPAVQIPPSSREQEIAREKEIFNMYADEINREMEDVLKYQVPIFEDEVSEV